LRVQQQDSSAEREAQRIAETIIGKPPGLLNPKKIETGLYRQPDPKKAESNKQEIPKEEIEAERLAEAERSRIKAGQLRAKYDKIAVDKLSKAKPDFTALGLDKPHKKVSEKNTPLSDEEVINALRDSWEQIFNKPISPDALSLLIAQWRTEGGRKGIFNYNLGNLTVNASSPSSDYAERSVPEIKEGKKVMVKSDMAAYDSVEQGAMGLINYIVSQRPALWAALESGNTEHYVFVMKSYGYFTAPVENIQVRGKVVEPGYLPLMQGTRPKPEKLIETPEAKTRRKRIAEIDQRIRELEAPGPYSDEGFQQNERERNQLIEERKQLQMK
jgi:hypothetical protein